MPDFDSLWNWARSRGEFQQEYTELRHIFDLMSACDCRDYLEVGCAEGNSLYILGHTVEENGIIAYIDYGEAHTTPARDAAIKALGRPVRGAIGDSTNPRLTDRLAPYHQKYDCVLIDGGHDFATVLSDSIMYASIAKKYVFWHDIQLPEVKAAFEWFKARWKIGKYSTFINSHSFGYGILEID